MEDYYGYGARPQPMPAVAPPSAPKRARPEYDVPPSHEMPLYYTRDEERGGHHVAHDTETLGASYDRYLRGQIPSYGNAEPPPRPMPIPGGGFPPIEDPRMMGGGFDPAMKGNGRNASFGGGRPEMPLPPDASNTLFVEGLPANATKREVSHIFRPFVGFKEVRLVNKESRNPGGDPLILCFVDFASSAHAAVALDALQGYKFDEHDRESAILRMQFARFPGPRSGGPRYKR